MAAIISKITAFFTAIVVFITGIPTLFYPKVPAAGSSAESEEYRLTEKMTLGDDIYVVSTDGHTEDEIHALISLQGIVAKTNPCIYIPVTSAYESYIDELEALGKNIIRTDENGEKWNLYTLIDKFSSYIGEGSCVIWKKSDFAYSLNVAVNCATLYGWLPVTKEIQAKLGDRALTVKLDLSAEEENLALQKKYYDEMKGKFKGNAFVHVKYAQAGMRDLAIQQGWYTCYTDGTDEGNAFLKQVLADYGTNTHVLGWVENEKNEVEIISEMGCTVNPLDHARNTSCLAHVDVTLAQQDNTATAQTDESKHYVTLLFTDGDNMQWIIGGYNEYFDKVENYNDIPMTWTFSPLISEFCPLMFNRVYNSAGSNNSIVCGPSGSGYCNPSAYDKESLDEMSRETAAAMLRSGQRVLTILDNYSLTSEADMTYSFRYFSRFDNIDGALLYLDPDKYASGQGTVWFSNDKPFVSTRLPLWYTGEGEVTDEWLKEQADIVNNYPVDIHSINGYSVICIHAWSVNSASVAKFISLLDDHVEILTAEDFMETVSENIPHRKAVPVSAN